MKFVAVLVLLMAAEGFSFFSPKQVIWTGAGGSPVCTAHRCCIVSHSSRRGVRTLSCDVDSKAQSIVAADLKPLGKCLVCNLVHICRIHRLKLWTFLVDLLNRYKAQ
jgi:hypothetical protein